MFALIIDVTIYIYFENNDSFKYVVNENSLSGTTKQSARQMCDI